MLVSETEGGGSNALAYAILYTRNNNTSSQSVVMVGLLPRYVDLARYLAGDGRCDPETHLGWIISGGRKRITAFRKAVKWVTCATSIILLPFFSRTADCCLVCDYLTTPYPQTLLFCLVPWPLSTGSSQHTSHCEGNCSLTRSLCL